MNNHPTAVIDTGAEIADDVQIGPFTVIENDVTIDSGTTIGPHALIASGARLGKNVRIHKSAVIGTLPQDLKFKGEPSVAIVGDNTIIREFVTVNRGTEASERTAIGQECLIMAYAHVAHDCILEDKVIMANSVNLAGHVVLEEQVIIGGLVPIHQFVRIGCHAFIAGGTRVPKDVPPFVLAANEPLRYAGLNSVGLKRRGFSADRIAQIKQAYKLLYHSGLNVSQGVTRIKEEMDISGDVKHIIDFIEGSERGII
ncbi:acyl-[acyl-carrier-protein]--UDP-N-acetylglucosamine O-acyltransferase [candidate division LCP-89 bacterium B3_LCP]|uniref:Acyl-[acyl-carrier-protein]--UDP-N-acetylglucosamine O-acyltransferase n=1 Tax=candidate division LCP-89 bacterium B3_LCP TaxID=2012998 RepID=A0A532UXY2_UNCL8|nr:MAG: acyl-[acyl-carrier-protein]--UDP-N-acetylglucosamine O-acyltransferase [candidate division LCP-89 bacterium B3_LCP]